MDPSSLNVAQNAYFSLLIHTKQLLLVTIFDMAAENGVIFWTQGQMNGHTDRRTDMEAEIVV